MIERYVQSNFHIAVIHVGPVITSEPAVTVVRVGVPGRASQFQRSNGCRSKLALDLLQMGSVPASYHPDVRVLCRFVPIMYLRNFPSSNGSGTDTTRLSLNFALHNPLNKLPSFQNIYDPHIG